MKNAAINTPKNKLETYSKKEELKKINLYGEIKS